ncbi:TlpA disulfide reductase family protein [Compostibacter hankyongensis]|uniref:TlpA family protein disulfide reductase n=1 Tax=Compostibacter hankyongensis TaxID=1007089 RepID=UPI0031EA3F20
MKKFTFLLAGIACPLCISAQSFPVRPLTVGDTVPDIAINNIINYKSPSLSTSSLRGKLLILDFMSTGCGGCIRVLPRFDSLTNQFRDTLQIILITPDNPDRINTFLRRNKYAKDLSLPIAANDTLLSRYFPHEFIPHEVWINAQGIVSGITHTQYVTERNIRKLLKGRKVNWVVKREMPLYNYTQPILVLNHANISTWSTPDIQYHTTLTGYLDGVSLETSELTDSDQHRIIISWINLPIISLYLKALDRSMAFPKSRMFLKVKSLDRFFYNSSAGYRDVWKKNNCYCYEAVLPDTLSRDQRLRKMKTDLDFYFGLQGSIEKRNTPCLVLKQADDVQKFHLRTEKEVSQIPHGYQLYISISALINNLNQTYYNLPVLDETGFNDRRYLPLKEMENLSPDALRKTLTRHGLLLERKNRIIEMFVLTE